MKAPFFGFLLALLLASAGCSGGPGVDFGGPVSGAYGRKIDEVHFAQARRHLSQGKSAAARKELEQISSEAQTAAMHLLVAESFMREGNANAANDSVSTAAHLDPEDPQVDIMRGMVAESVGDWRQASKSYRLASIKDQDNLDSVLAHARTLHAMGDGVRAASYLEDEVESRPVNFDLSLATAEAFLSIGSPEDAIAHYSNATDLNADDIKAREGLVLSLSLSGAHREALLRAGSLSADTWSSAAQLSLGRSALLVGEGKRAAALLNSYLHEFDSEPAVWLDLARAYYLDRRDKLSLSALGRALKLNKQDPAAYTLIGHIRLRSGQSDLAFAAYERAIQSGGDAIMLTELMDRALQTKDSKRRREL